MGCIGVVEGLAKDVLRMLRQMGADGRRQIGVDVIRRGQPSLRSGAKAESAPLPRVQALTRSRDNVGRQLIFEARQLVPQQELSLLEPLDLQLVRLTGLSERLDRRIEIAMLLSQPLDLRGERRAFLRREPLLIHSGATLRQALHALNVP